MRHLQRTCRWKQMPNNLKLHGGQTAVQCKKKISCPGTCPVTCPVKGWSHLCHALRLGRGHARYLILVSDSLPIRWYSAWKKLWKFWELTGMLKEYFRVYGGRKYVAMSVCGGWTRKISDAAQLWGLRHKICAIKSRLWFVSSDIALKSYELRWGFASSQVSLNKSGR